MFEENMEDVSIDTSYGSPMIYRQDTIIPPKEIRWKLVELAHSAHQADGAMYATVKQLW